MMKSFDIIFSVFRPFSQEKYYIYSRSEFRVTPFENVSIETNTEDELSVHRDSQLDFPMLAIL